MASRMVRCPGLINLMVILLDLPALMFALVVMRTLPQTGGASSPSGAHYS